MTRTGARLRRWLVAFAGESGTGQAVPTVTEDPADFRCFGLRDNNSAGPTFQQHFGLLRDDYSPKPAYAVYLRAVARYGARER